MNRDDPRALLRIFEKTRAGELVFVRRDETGHDSIVEGCVVSATYGWSERTDNSSDVKFESGYDAAIALGAYVSAASVPPPSGPDPRRLIRTNTEVVRRRHLSTVDDRELADTCATATHALVELAIGTVSLESQEYVHGLESWSTIADSGSAPDCTLRSLPSEGLLPKASTDPSKFDAKRCFGVVQARLAPITHATSDKLSSQLGATRMEFTTTPDLATPPWTLQSDSKSLCAVPCAANVTSVDALSLVRGANSIDIPDPGARTTARVRIESHFEPWRFLAGGGALLAGVGFGAMAFYTPTTSSSSVSKELEARGLMIVVGSILVVYGVPTLLGGFHKWPEAVLQAKATTTMPHPRARARVRLLGPAILGEF
ncbi:MAG: hypothetical protein NVSMB1_11070 [Polyangiales bacterium]